MCVQVVKYKIFRFHPFAYLKISNKVALWRLDQMFLRRKFKSFALIGLIVRLNIYMGMRRSLPEGGIDKTPKNDEISIYLALFRLG